MKVGSISTFSANNAINLRKQNAEKLPVTNYLKNDTVNFTGNTSKLRRWAAGAMATLGIMLAIAPTAKAAATPKSTPADSKDSVVEVAPMPTIVDEIVDEFPLPHPTIVDNDDTDYSGSFRPVSLPYDELPEYIKQTDKELSEMDGITRVDTVSPWNMEFDEYLESVLPQENEVEDSDDLIIVQLKHEANARILAGEAAHFLELADSYAKAEYYDLSDRVVAFAQKVTDASADYTQKAQDTSDTIEAIRQRVIGSTSSEEPAFVPTIAPVPPIVYPVIDTYEDIFGYGKYFDEQYAELIPNSSELSKSEIDAILTQKVAQLREEVQNYETEAKEREAKLKEDLTNGTVEYKDDTFQSEVFSIASIMKKAEVAKYLANFYDRVINGEVPVPAVKPVIDPVPTLTPAVPQYVYPSIDTYEDLFGYDKYFAEQYAELIPDASGLSKSEINAILADKVKELRTQIQEYKDEADRLEAELNEKWYAPDADYKALESDIFSIAAIRKDAERANILANFFNKVISGEKTVPVIDPEPEPTPVPTETEVIGCTFEDIFGFSEDDIPTPVPTKAPEVIGCTFEDIFGFSEEELNK